VRASIFHLLSISFTSVGLFARGVATVTTSGMAVADEPMGNGPPVYCVCDGMNICESIMGSSCGQETCDKGCICDDADDTCGPA